MELKKGVSDKVNVKKLQELLTSKGFPCTADGDFGAGTEKKVKEYQASLGLAQTGVVDDSLWNTLNVKPTGIVIVDQFMEKGEYYEEVFEKNTVYIHHTAGAHRADYVIKAWDTDDVVDEKVGKKSVRVVATAYVIGGLSTRVNTDVAFDGAIYRAFDDKYWAHHLGTTFANNRKLNQQSIGIEICNYGPLKKGADGKYYTYVNTVVPDNMVCKLDKPFKGYQYYHNYSDKQIKATRDLLLFLKAKYPKIEMRTPLLTAEGFELNDNAKKGVPGIYNHTNVRTDKFDIYPHPKMIAMLKELCTS